MLSPSASPAASGPVGRVHPARWSAAAKTARRGPVELPALRAPLAVLAASLVVAATGFDYVWTGPVPLWLICFAIGAGATLARAWGGRAVLDTTRRLWGTVVAPWLAFLAVIVVSDVMNGALEESASGIVLLGLLGIGAFLLTATWAMRMGSRRVVLGLAVLAAVQGALAILQFAGLEWAWRVPTEILAFSPRGEQIAVAAATRGFEEVGRVRGTHLFVHKFTAAQGIVVAFLVVVSMSAALGRELSGRARRLVWAAVVVATVGSLLTFSRSTFIGLVATGLAVVLVPGGARRQIWPFAVLVGAVALAALFLDVGSGSHSGRLLDLSGAALTRDSRWAVWGFAIGEFMRAPLFGVGSSVDTSSVGISIHSVPLRVLASYGMLGAVPYALCLAGVARWLWWGARSPQPMRRTLGRAGLAAFGVGLLDCAVHTSGFALRDIAQPVLAGLFVGQVLRPQGTSRRRA
jgi:hypothetical protein